MAPIVAELKSKKATVGENRQFLKSSRQGQYLIKVNKNNLRNWCGESEQYIDYTYLQRGWFALSTRKEAQWFFAHEAHEFVSCRKGFHMVKR
jgi:hypothetical protein